MRRNACRHAFVPVLFVPRAVPHSCEGKFIEEIGPEMEWFDWKTYQEKFKTDTILEGHVPFPYKGDPTI